MTGAWAEWVAWHLSDAGYDIELDCWEWGPEDNFVLKMSGALSQRIGHSDVAFTMKRMSRPTSKPTAKSLPPWRS